MKLKSLKTLAKAPKLKRLFVPLAMLFGVYNTANATPGTCYGVTIGAPSCGSSFVTDHPGGTWTSSNPSIVTVDGSGNISTIGIGMATITYTYTDPSGCGSLTYYYPVTVDPPPTLSGTATMCVGGTASLSASPTGGTWTSGALSVATVGSASGVVTGVSGGTAAITYTEPTMGCQATKIVTVNSATILGAASVCEGLTITLTASTFPAGMGGSWNSSNSSIATVSTTGVVTGVSPGTVDISYTTTGGCVGVKTITVGQTININVCQTAPFAHCDPAMTYSSALRFTVSNVPTGVTPAWSPSIAATFSTVGPVLTYSFTTAPTATKTYTVSVSKDGCSAQDVVTIAVPSGGCSPEDIFKPVGCATVVPYTTIATNLTSVNVNPSTVGYYYIANASATPGADISYTLSVSPAPGSVFVVDKNVKLNVPATSDVTLDHCHFMAQPSCLWKGIEVVASTTTVYGKLKIIGNTLIEHVNGNAVTFNNAAPPAFAAGVSEVIKSDGAIYNHNNVGIYLQELRTLANPPFVIKNSVFSARDFSKFRNAGEECNYLNYYPFVWPTTAQLKTPYGATGYNPGLAIDTFVVSSTAILYGVRTLWVGLSNTSGSTPVFGSLTIGDSTDASKTNLFDLNSHASTAGCRIDHSNVVFSNSIFRGLNDGIMGTFANFNALQLYSGSTDNTNNRFHDCVSGVNSTGALYFVSRNSLMSATNTNSPKVTKGAYGFKISVSNPTNYQHIIDSNTIKNVEMGIQLTANQCNNGEIYIRENAITGLTASAGSEYAKTAIHLIVDGCTTPSASNLYVNRNNISGCVIGIDGYTQNQEAYIDSNKIKLIAVNPALSLIPVGIDMNHWNDNTRKHNRLRSVSFNHVYGDGTSVKFNTPLPVTATGGDDRTGTVVGYCGIQIEKAGTVSVPTVVKCNYVHDVPIGFNFLDQSYLDWKTNVMARSKYAMALQLQKWKNTTIIPASIGNQGGVCAPNDNFWSADGGTGWLGWNTTSGTECWQTYTTGEEPAANNSILYVRTGTGYTPTENGKQDNTYASLVGTAYATPASIDVCTETLASAIQCGPYYWTSEPAGRAASSGRTMPEISAPEETYSIFPNPTNDNISITSGTTSNETIQVNIRNYASASVYSGELQLKSGTASVKLPNVVPGVYMLEVKDGKGAAHNYKLVIQSK